MKIPSAGPDTYDVSQLDEADVFGSRASSVTVMSELDRQSLLSPFASPVNNQGADTPTVRPHPFSIRSGNTPSSTAGEHHKGSQSESDSVDSLHLLRNDSASSGNSLRQAAAKKSPGTSHSSEFSSPSQGSNVLLRKNSPLLSSARTANSHARKPEENPPPRSENHTDRCNCHYGNPTTCATIACCESMGMCRIEDGFLTFDPSRRSRDASHVDPGHAHLHTQCEMEDKYSLGHLASYGFLGPTQSLDSGSATSSAPPSHTSCSSLDSGYDQSSSLTNSSRDSAEFTGSFVMVGSNRNMHPEGVRCACSEIDSGRGSQCSCLKERGCKRTLCFSDVTTQEACPPVRAGQGVGVARNSPSARNTQHGHLHCHEDQSGVNCNTSVRLPTGRVLSLHHSIPSSSRGRGNDAAHTLNEPQSDCKDTRVPDPTNSLFPMKLSNFDPSKLTEELPSPLSPEPLDKPDSVSLGGVSSDPLIPLPMQKLKNYIQTMDQTRSVATCSPNSACYDLTNPGGSQQFEYADAGLSIATSSLSELTSSSIGQLRNVYSTSSVPVSHSTYDTPPPSSSSSLKSSSSSLSHTPLAHLPHCSFDSRSISSEADSGRGTKSSLKTGELDARSLSQISEMSYEMDPDYFPCTLSPHDQRASSSPPTTGSQPRGDKEACLIGPHRSFPMLAKSQCGELGAEPGRTADEGMSQDCVDDKSTDLALRSLKAFRNNRSILHQQLHQRDQELETGQRPSTLKQFDDFTDVLLPQLDDFHLDMPTHCYQEEPAVQRHPMSDFGHSLFVG